MMMLRRRNRQGVSGDDGLCTKRSKDVLNAQKKRKEEENKKKKKKKTKRERERKKQQLTN